MPDVHASLDGEQDQGVPRYPEVGHTPTQLLYDAVGHGSAQGKIYRTESFIDIDCGCVYSGGRLGCLCLDTMEEIYV